jgi:hypothetical protein
VGLVFERILPLVKPNPQKKLRWICQTTQNPRCPPGGNLGFRVVILDFGWCWFSKGSFLQWTSTHKNISGRSEQVFLNYSTETKAGARCNTMPSQKICSGGIKICLMLQMTHL